MLNDISLKLLKGVCLECSGTGYKVYSLLELAELVSEIKPDNQTVKENVISLSMGGYISVKYVDDVEVCLAVLDKGRQIFESRLDTETQSVNKYKKEFLNTFCGALVGGLLTAVVFIILFFLLGCA